MKNDWQLLREYVEVGSAAAFAELVERYADLVYGCCLRQTRDPHAAADVSQAVYMVLARRAADVKEGVPLGGWLFNIARHCSRNYRLVEARHRR